MKDYPRDFRDLITVNYVSAGFFSRRILGIGIQPNLTTREISVIKDFIINIDVKRFVFVDLAPTDSIFNLINTLAEKGQIVGFYDHHENKHEPDNIENAKKIYEFVERKRNFQFFPRQEKPSATMMVKRKQWIDMDIDIVFFHDDLGDGWLAFIKGLFEGDIYPNLNDDAMIFDGVTNGKSLSDIGMMIKLSRSKGVSHGISPESRQLTRNLIYFNLIRLIKYGFDDPVIQFFLENLQEVKSNSIKLVQIILRNHLAVENNILVADCVEILRRNKNKPDFSLLTKNLLAMVNDEYLIACRQIDWQNHVVYRVIIPDRLAEKFNHLDFRELLTSEDQKRSHLPQRIYVSPNNWKIFKENVKLFL